MPDELEQRLQRTLASIPPPGDDATERARRAALDALPPAPEPRRWRRRRLLVPAAACAVAFVFGGVTLAATGGHLPLVGNSPKPHHPAPTVPAVHPAAAVLPRGAIAFSAAADGRVWLATSAGATLRGSPLSALAVSPGAVYLLEAQGRSLRAVHVPDGRTAFTRGVAGEAAATAWAPAGIRIAYVVHTPAANRLYDMFGNGTHVHLVAAHTNGQAPSWRWDSLVFAYIRADGTVMVHDPGSGATSALAPGCGIRRPAALAFAPVRRPACDRRPLGPRAGDRHPPPQPRPVRFRNDARDTQDRLAAAAPAPGRCRRDDHPVRRRRRSAAAWT